MVHHRTTTCKFKKNYEITCEKNYGTRRSDSPLNYEGREETKLIYCCMKFASTYIRCFMLFLISFQHLGISGDEEVFA